MLTSESVGSEYVGVLDPATGDAVYASLPTSFDWTVTRTLRPQHSLSQGFWSSNAAVKAHKCLDPYSNAEDARDALRVKDDYSEANDTCQSSGALSIKCASPLAWARYR
jgi:hypothetical protein